MGLWGTLACAAIFDLGWIGLVVSLAVHEAAMRTRGGFFSEDYRSGLMEWVVAACMLLAPVAVDLYMLGPWLH